MKNNKIRTNVTWIVDESEQFVVGGVPSFNKNCDILTINLYDLKTQHIYPKNKPSETLMASKAHNIYVMHESLIYIQQKIETNKYKLVLVDYDGFPSSVSVPDIKNFKLLSVTRSYNTSNISEAYIKKTCKQFEQEQLQIKNNRLDIIKQSLSELEGISNDKIKEIEAILAR